MTIGTVACLGLRARSATIPPNGQPARTAGERVEIPESMIAMPPKRQFIEMMLKKTGLRMGLVCFAAVSAGLSLALVSIAKVLLVIAFLAMLLCGKRSEADFAALRGMWTTRLVALVVLVFACSLLWTSAPLHQALSAFGKYGKFLVIPAFLMMTRTPKEALLVLMWFLGGQAFLLVSSWLLYLHVPVMWASSNMARISYAVFSSYLDQGIMSAATAAVFWHLRALAPSRGLRGLAIAISLLALGNVFAVFMGRTGHLVGIAMVSLAVFWALPPKYRLASLFLPPLIFAIAFVSFDKVAERFSTARSELSAYSVKPEAVTSSGVRLSFWKTSLEAIAENPLIGSGVGSWATEYNRIKRADRSVQQELGVGSNPHQEFLLWGVQLGVGGIVLLLALLGAVFRDLQKMSVPVARAGQSVVVALVLSCLLNSSIYDAYIGDFFCLSLGVLLAYGLRREALPDTPVSQAANASGVDVA